MTALDLVFVLSSLAGGAAVLFSWSRVAAERRRRAAAVLHAAALAAGWSLASLGTAVLVPAGVLAGAILGGVGWAGWLRGGRWGRWVFLVGIVAGVLTWPGIRSGKGFTVSLDALRSRDERVAALLMKRLEARESRSPVLLAVARLDVLAAMEAGRSLGDGGEDLLVSLGRPGEERTARREELVRRGLAASGLPVLTGGSPATPRIFLIPGALRIVFLGDATPVSTLEAMAADLSSAPLILVDERDGVQSETADWSQFAAQAGVDLVIETGRRRDGVEWADVERVCVPMRGGPWALRIELDGRGGFRTRKERWAGAGVVVPWDDKALLGERVVAARDHLPRFLRLMAGLMAGSGLFWGALIALGRLGRGLTKTPE